MRLFLLALCAAGLTACQTPTDATEPTDDAAVTVTTAADYPAALTAVFDAHGGLDAWRSQRQLGYDIVRGEQTEYQMVDLHDRREYVRQPGKESGAYVEQGYDGDRLWTTADTSAQGNPKFYQGLMFYFYAMPWVLADPGIVYAEADPLTFGDVSYPGILISYNDGVGYSPKDNYRLHYDPDTKRMRWLGYTVTGRSGKRSDKFSWIEYPTWSAHNGVALPDSLVWYTVEDNQPVAPRNTRAFTSVTLSAQPPAAERFAMPTGGRVVE